jgi:hypothetical protein
MDCIARNGRNKTNIAQMTRLVDAESSGRGLAIMAVRTPEKLLAGLLLNKVQRVADLNDLFGFFVRDLDTEFFFQGHDQLNQIKRIGIEVGHELSFRHDLFRLHAELLSNDRLYSLQHLGQRGYLPLQ